MLRIVLKLRNIVHFTDTDQTVYKGLALVPSPQRESTIEHSYRLYATETVSNQLLNLNL